MTKTYGKSRLPSRHVTEGPERAPHRSYLYAMGIPEAGIYAPLVGVATDIGTKPHPATSHWAVRRKW